MTVAQRWGLHPATRTLAPKLMRDLLVRRYAYARDDVPHVNLLECLDADGNLRPLVGPTREPDHCVTWETAESVVRHLYDHGMAQEMAEARGRAMIRPWRVGVLADTSPAEAVREAIAHLSSVWGGRYMPIFDIGVPTEELEQLGHQYDIDSIYADGV